MSRKSQCRPSKMAAASRDNHCVRRQDTIVVHTNDYENLINDLKHALRGALRSPGFAGIMVLALAIGIGANTAVFSVMNAVLLKPLPYQNPDHIVTVTGRSS